MNSFWEVETWMDSDVDVRMNGRRDKERVRVREENEEINEMENVAAFLKSEWRCQVYTAMYSVRANLSWKKCSVEECKRNAFERWWYVMGAKREKVMFETSDFPPQL